MRIAISFANSIDHEPAREEQDLVLVNQVRIEPIEAATGGTWVQLSPFGDFPHSQGLQRFTVDDAKEIVSNFNKLGNIAQRIMGLPWYIGHPDHPAFKAQYPDGQAYGRIKQLETRADGLWGLVKFNAKGKELVNQEAFHGHSVNWAVKRKGNAYHPCALKSVGFTNEPNIPVAPILHANVKAYTRVDPRTGKTIQVGEYEREGEGEGKAAKPASDDSDEGIKAKAAEMIGREEALLDHAKTLFSGAKLGSQIVDGDKKQYAVFNKDTGEWVEFDAPKGGVTPKKVELKEVDSPSEKKVDKVDPKDDPTGAAKNILATIGDNGPEKWTAEGLQGNIENLTKVRAALHKEFTAKAPGMKPKERDKYIELDKQLKDKLDAFNKFKQGGGIDAKKADQAKQAVRDRIDKGKEAGSKRAADEPSEADKVEMVQDFAGMLEDAGEIITPKLVAEQIKNEHGVAVDVNDIKEILAQMKGKKQTRANESQNDGDITPMKLSELSKRLGLAEDATEEAINTKIDGLLANQTPSGVLNVVRTLMGNEQATETECVNFVNAMAESEEGTCETRLNSCTGDLKKAQANISTLEEAQKKLANEAQEAKAATEAAQGTIKALRIQTRDLLIANAIRDGRITLAQRDDFANKIDADWDKGTTELANVQASTGLKTQSVTGAVGTSHKTIANAAERRQAALDLVNAKMAEGKLNYDQAYAAATKERPDLFANAK